MEPVLFKSVASRVNASFFGFNSVGELFEREQAPSKIIDSPWDVIKDRFKRSDDVMYVNIGGSQADNACPSIADSAAVSLAQMAFLSMTVSIFTVVATVANNINNNNNNHNENNLNVVQQKQNSLSMNQNIVNQINIDLPPPVPGKRSIPDANDSLKSKVRQYKEKQLKSLTSEATEAILNMLTSQNFSPNKRECIGRELCLKSLQPHQASLAHLVLESFALLYLQLDDHSDSFSAFIEEMNEKSHLESVDRCFHLFPNCGAEEDYVLYRMR